jgi:stringent starvation protein B
MTTASTKPYFIRAIHQWCIDQGFTPYLAAVVDRNTRVPPGSARDGQTVLNLSYDATHELSIGNDLITFQARFGGVAHSLAIPVANVIAIYARENGQGMAFEPEVVTAAEAEPKGAEPIDAPQADGVDLSPDDGSGGATGGSTASRRGAHLKVVK